MIVVECCQGTPEWHQARLGIPTASCFDKILTPTGKPSAQAEAYAHTLLAEILTGEAQGWGGNGWTDRGKELEGEAREYYEFATGQPVEQVGFCLRDDRRVGCSPDGLVGDSGLIEIKCPAPHTHVKYLLDGKAPTDYLAQIQGELYVTGREWCDFLSYHPEMPKLLVRVERNPAYQRLLEEELGKFMEALTKKAGKLGPGDR